MLRRIVLTAAATAAALGAAPPTALADTVPLSLDRLLGSPDHLSVTVEKAGPGMDGDYALDCDPVGGTHPNPDGACRRLALASEGGDPFSPVPRAAVCTLQYGGAATAHVTGTWHGHSVDTVFRRTNGCEIDRWQRLVPLLPAVGRG